MTLIMGLVGLYVRQNWNVYKFTGTFRSSFIKRKQSRHFQNTGTLVVHKSLWKVAKWK